MISALCFLQGVEHIRRRLGRRLKHDIVTIDHDADARGPC